MRLNNSVEQLTEKSEIYRLRLLNVDLKQQIQQYKQESQGVVTRQKVEEILNYFQKQQMKRELNLPTKEALDALESVQF